MLTTGGVGLGAIHASGAFDVAEASRRFNLGVSDDHEALLKIEENPDISGEAGESVELATITNEFSEELSSLEITTAGGGPVTLDSSDQPTTLSSGEETDIFGELSCSSELDERVTVQILADGPDNRVELARDIDVHCEPADETCVDEYTEQVTLRDDTSCDVEVSTDNAHVHILPHTTISGDIHIDGAYDGSLHMNSSTINGDLTIDAGYNGIIHLNSSTINGDVTIDAGYDGTLDMNQSTIDGDVSIDAGYNTNVNKNPGSTITGDSPDS